MENQGGAGSAKSHFERRVFGQEIMTASTIEDSRISKFTLSLLASTGWYQVDMTMAEPLAWGKGEGCGFITGPCMSSATTTNFPNEFCTHLNKLGCTIGGKAQGYCGEYKTLITDTTLIAPFNYWGNYTELTEGYGDNCPFYRAFSNAKCEDPTAVTQASWQA